MSGYAKTDRPTPKPRRSLSMPRDTLTDIDIVQLAKDVGSGWLKIARRLPMVDQTMELAFTLDDRRLAKISRESPDDEECLIQVLNTWRNMSVSHTWGPLRDTLVECGFGTVANTIDRRRSFRRKLTLSGPEISSEDPPLPPPNNADRNSSITTNYLTGLASTGKRVNFQENVFVCSTGSTETGEGEYYQHRMSWTQERCVVENRVIKRNMTFLINHLDLSAILESVLENDVISTNFYFELLQEQKESGHEAAATSFVRTLLRTPEQKVKTFIKCMEGIDSLSHVAEKLKAELSSDREMSIDNRDQFTEKYPPVSDRDTHPPETPDAASSASKPAFNQQLTLMSKAEFSEYVSSEETICSALVSVQAPAELGDESNRPRLNLVLVMDRSGSMEGRKLFMLKKTFRFIISQMRSTDRLGLVLFDDRVTVPFPCMLHMDECGKAKMLSEVQRITAGGSTNLSDGLLRGIRMTEDLQTNPTFHSDVTAVLLMTDGEANVGLVTTDSIVACLKSEGRKHAARYQHNAPSTCQVVPDENAQLEQNILGPAGATVYTFGFGTEHNVGLLQALSGATNGMYNFINLAEKIPESFADCLGGLLSTVAQNISMELTTSNGVNIVSAFSGRDKKSSASGATCTLPLGDIQSEERRDIVLKLSLPILESEQMEWSVLHAKLSYFNVITSTMETRETQLTVSRPSTKRKGLESDKDVELHRGRVAMTTALQEAIHLADSGNMRDAQCVMQKALADFSTVGDKTNPIHQSLSGEANTCLKNMTMGKWSSGGKQSSESVCEMHRAQRRSSSTSTADYGVEEGGAYDTTARLMMRVSSQSSE